MATTTLPAHVDASQHFATKADLAQLETRLMRWFIGILVAIIVNAVGVIISIILAAL